MSYQIDVIDETESLDDKDLTLVTEILKSACERLKLEPETECSLVFVTEERIQELNKLYRDKDSVTDVLSFALNDEDGFAEDENVLGDIVICVPRMKEQALEYDHSNERELGFLAIHGLLHLLGYDHGTKEEEEKMFALQEELLTAYGLGRET